jgi:hypothetical protein
MLPANTEIYISAFKSIVEFESLKPDVILDKLFPKVLKKKYTLQSLITGK